MPSSAPLEHGEAVAPQRGHRQRVAEATQPRDARPRHERRDGGTTRVRRRLETQRHGDLGATRVARGRALDILRRQRTNAHDVLDGGEHGPRRDLDDAFARREQREAIG
jgi:hypothetical protein